MKISLSCALAAAAMLGCLAGCGFGRPFHPAGWDCRVYRIEFSNDLENCSRRTIPATSEPPEVDALFDVLKDPFLESTPWELETQRL